MAVASRASARCCVPRRGDVRCARDASARPDDHHRSPVVKTVPVVVFSVAGVNAKAGIGRPYTCVYDGQCKVCTRLSKLLAKWDRHHQIEIIPSQASGVMARFPWIPSRAYAEALQLI